MRYEKWSHATEVTKSCVPRMKEVIVLVISEEEHSINSDSLKSDTSRRFSVDTTSMLLSLILVALKMLTGIRKGWG